jgi:hypothetical protein
VNTKSMIDGGEITAEETIAIQLWYTFVTENGTIQRALDWTPDANPMYVAAQKWANMEPHERDVWLAVATTAQRVVNR